VASEAKAAAWENSRPWKASGLYSAICSKLALKSSTVPAATVRLVPKGDFFPHSNLAGAEAGLVASNRNITS
jgi:hypothetical protein